MATLTKDHVKDAKFLFQRKSPPSSKPPCESMLIPTKRLAEGSQLPTRLGTPVKTSVVLKAVKGASLASQKGNPPQWFIGCLSDVLQAPQRLPPRLDEKLTPAAMLQSAREAALVPSASRFNLSAAGPGRPSDTLIGPVVSGGDVFRWRLRILDCDDGELSLKVFAVPVAEMWYLSSAGLCLWAPRGFRLRDDADLHATNHIEPHKDTANNGIAKALQRGDEVQLVLDRSGRRLSCYSSDVDSIGESIDLGDVMVAGETCVPVVELGTLSDVKWVAVGVTDEQSPAITSQGALLQDKESAYGENELMATLQRALSQGPKTVDSPWVQSSEVDAVVSEEALLHSTVCVEPCIEPVTEPPTRKPSLDKPVGFSLP